MDILIKNMEIPKEKYIRVEIHHDGTMYVQKNGYYSFYVKSQDKAIELPPHGRLCDLDALIEHETYNIEQALFDSDEVLEDLKNAPVIVEANNE